jgi:hypothetical protein
MEKEFNIIKMNQKNMKEILLKANIMGKEYILIQIKNFI